MVYTLTKDNKDEILNKVLSDTADFISVCESFGYSVIYPFFELDPVKNKKSLELELRENSNRGSYMPEIFFSSGDCFRHIKDDGKIEFSANPAAYGKLSPVEFEKFVNAQNKAFQFLQWLNNYKGWEKFPVIVFDC